MEVFIPRADFDVMWFIMVDVRLEPHDPKKTCPADDAIFCISRVLVRLTTCKRLTKNPADLLSRRFRGGECYKA